MSKTVALTVLTSDGTSNVREVGSAIRSSKGSLLLALTPAGLVMNEEDAFRFFRELKALNVDRQLTVATKHKKTLELARRAGWHIISKSKELHAKLKGHPQLSEALRTFSPKLWREQIRTQLQSLGLLSLPKIRIWILFATSVSVFVFIIFKLLPSATLHIWPSEEPISQTMNVLLVASGATDVPQGRVKTLPLLPLTVKVDRSMTFDEIGKEFTGTNAELVITVFNDSEDQFSLRKGTRFVNQAGMVFRLKRDIIIAPKSNVKGNTIADEVDQFNEIIGERGNVPIGLKWEIPGLPQEQRILVYGRNEEVGVGGKTSHRNVLRDEDLIIARKKLEQELKATARQMISDETTTRNLAQGSHLIELQYEELTRLTFSDMKLPTEFIGQHVQSIPIEGSAFYTVLLYDEDLLFELMKERLLDGAGDQRIIKDDSVTKENMILYVIDAPWDAPIISWVKITADLSATQRYLLDPLTIVGARFGKQVRDAVTGKSIDEAERIIKNLPEVSKVDISIWPFWSRTLPAISSNIHVIEEQ